MLCSVLLPSRGRPKKLCNALASITSTATGDDYEILIRLDEDDCYSMAIRDAIHKVFPQVREIFTGPRLGYSELDIGYYAGLEREAKGNWCWIAGDDMQVIGDWYGELFKVPTHGYIVQPEVSRLGGSVYRLAEAQAFPIFPRFCWRDYAETFPRPFDTSGHELLVANGWKTWFLPGVCMHHWEASPAELAKHREMECTT